MKKIIILSIIALLPSCASIVNGKTQDVTVQTTPEMTAMCNLKNELGEWEIEKTPAQINIKRSKTDLVVQCHNDTHKGTVRNSSDAESWTVGNLVFGGVIGAGVDAGTGAMFSYDDVITVPMQKK